MISDQFEWNILHKNENILNFSQKRNILKIKLYIWGTELVMFKVWLKKYLKALELFVKRNG